MLNDGHWDYVANPSGGFLGFWWKFRGDKNCEQYLQLEQKKLCFKIYVKHASERRALRSRWHRRIIEKSEGFNLRITKPNRFGSGQYMTVCIFEGDYRVSKNGVIDLEATLDRLRKAEDLLMSVS
jgi:hypothetical protein